MVQQSEGQFFLIEGHQSKLEQPLTFKAHKHMAFRLYPNNKPNNLEIAKLQKGLVLMFDNQELIEEGIGFGVPVVKYEDKTYFSSSARVTRAHGNGDVLVKSFLLDTISRKRVGKASYVNDDFYSFFHRIFEKAYFNCRKLSPLFNLIMALRKTLKVQTEFVKTAPRGTVTVTYTCLPNNIKVNVDLTRLNRAGCKQILLLNEQGSTFFRKYSDTTGTSLLAKSIGAWATVNAEEASLSDVAESLQFTLKQVKKARLFRGWENTKGRFSWAGLSYSLNAYSPNFDYTIELHAHSHV